ncbi:MAG: AsmA family protein, partial [Alphaproteobacteria bacterium]|nr:AsmA family protein [Alphaproteobacteria bacterium]
MKKFFLSILVVIALVIGTALVAPSFIDWNAYRAEIAAEIEKATGRAIAIDGAIDVALLPAPKLSLTKARLANLEGAAKPDMVRLEALELRISLMPLLSGKLVVQSVVLKGADIELEHLADGRENWKFKTARKGGSRGSGSGLGNGGETGGDRVSLEQVVIENGTLTYRDSRKGTVKRISQINARIAAATLSGPIAARGRFHLGGVPVDFEFQAGRIVTGASTKISLETKFPDAKAKITYSGFVTPGTPSFTFSGKVSSAGPDLANLVSTLARAGGGKISRKRVFARSYRFTAAVKGGAHAIAINDVSAEVNGTRATGAVNIALGATTDIDAVLKVNRLDLDRWLALAGQAGGRAAAPSRAAKGAPARFSLPRDLNVTLEADIGGFVFNKGVVRDIQFRGRLEKGVARLSRLSARLPGGSDVNLSGRLTASHDKPRFDGRLRLDAGDFRALVRWLGGDDSKIAPDRLRKLHYRTGIGIDPDRIELRDMDLQFDASRITGGVVVALRDRIGMGVRLNVDRLNLDAYLPAKKVQGQGPAAGTDKVDSKKEEKKAAKPVAGGGAQSLLALLGAFDANLRLSAGRLTYQGEQLRGLRLDGTLIGGTLKLEKLSIADLAGARFEAKGTIQALDKSPVPDLDVKLDAKNPRRLLSLVGFPVVIAPEQLAPFSLKGNFKAKGNATRLDIGVSAGKLELTAKGAFADLATAPRVAFELGVKHPSFLDFVRLFDPKFEPEKKIDENAPLILKAKVIGTGLDFKLEGF